MASIPFYKHDLGSPELDLVAEVLSGDILTTGKYVEQFEERFAALLNCKHALGVTSCTGALHMALLGLNIGPGDEVITTPMSFIATSTAILSAGAVPVFVDVETDSGNIDANLIEAAITPRTRAIMPVHLFGLMCDMRRIREIADRHELKIIEDAAHCIEGRRSGISVGQLSDIACFSFYATKNMACGEGGGLVTNNTELWRLLKLIRNHGMDKTASDRNSDGYSHWDMPVMGWKYNMSNIEAAFLLPQFDRLQQKLESREELSRYYTNILKNIEGIRVPAQKIGSDSIHAHHVYPIWIDGGRRDDLILYMQKNNIGVVVNYRPIHIMSYFKSTFGSTEGDFPIAEQIGEETLSLPFYPDMPAKYIDQVCEKLMDFVNK